MTKPLKAQLQALRKECYTLYFAFKHPDTPWYVRGLAFIVIGYAFSPIDLIPDFIPVLGQLDDLILVPLGVWLVLKLIPQHVLEASRTDAAALAEKPTHPAFMIIIVLTWLVMLWVIVTLILRALSQA